MRAGLLALRAAGAAVFLVAVAPAGATAAEAHGGVVVTVAPATAAPGGTERITVSGCAGGATVRSDAFTARREATGATGATGPTGSRADAAVRSGARPGLYGVSAACGGRVGTAELRVVGAAGHAAAASMPHVPADAGRGTAVLLAADGRSATSHVALETTGLGTPYTVLGLVLAAVAAVAVALRSARRHSAGRHRR